MGGGWYEGKQNTNSRSSFNFYLDVLNLRPDWVSERQRQDGENLPIRIETYLIPLNCVRFVETAREVEKRTVSYADEATGVSERHHKSDKTE